MNARPSLLSLPLENFEHLQARYHAMPLAERAARALADAGPALEAAEAILLQLAAGHKMKPLFESLRGNAALTGKMRGSEAKTALMDGNADFLDASRKKLSSWRKTMERLAAGEGIMGESGTQHIDAQAPVAAAILGGASVSGFLSIVQIALAEMGKADTEHAAVYSSNIAKIRRCATILSDCDNAASFIGCLH